MPSHKKNKRIKNRKLLDSFHSKPCIICSAIPSDPCHLKSKGSGGDDVEENLIALCREHHVIQHKLGIVTFIERHPSVKFYITMMGWEIVNGKLVRK